MNERTTGSAGDLRPGVAVVGGLENPLTIIRIAVNALAGADPDVALAINRDRANRLHRFIVEDRREGRAAVAAAPYSAASGANVHQVDGGGIDRDGSHSSRRGSHWRSSEEPAEVGKIVQHRLRSDGAPGKDPA
jgi:hypothetical protein